MDVSAVPNTRKFQLRMELVEKQPYNELNIRDIYTATFSSPMHTFMAATPEESFGFLLPTPPSPSIFINLPLTPYEQPRHVHVALDSISRMLMEEGMVEKFLHQYPNHPIMLQAQESFAQILYSSNITSSRAQDQQPTAPSPQPSPEFLPRTMGSSMDIRNRNLTISMNATDREESSSSFPPIEGSTTMHTLSTNAFFKGMEEARLFLPKHDDRLSSSGQKKRFDEDDEARTNVSRRKKQIKISVQLESQEHATAIYLQDQSMFKNHNLWPGAIQELRVASEIEQQNMCKKEPRMRRSIFVVDLETLLLRCAEAVASNDQHNAVELLKNIKGHSSPMGATTERLAHYFAEGLEARMTGIGSQLYHSLMAKHTFTVEHVKACKIYMDATCSTKVVFLFSNKTICNIAAGKSRLHIVDYGINDGLQWKNLLRLLASRDGGPPEVRITGINRQQPPFHLDKRTEEAGRRLIRCARKFGVPFKFHAITAKFETIHIEDLDINPDELLIVNSTFQFRTLMDESLIVDRINPRDLVLNTIRKMKPALFIHGIVNASYSAASFVTRFREALHNFSAAFDFMEATVSRDNNLKLVVERAMFARSAMNIIACEGVDRVERMQNYKDWQVRNQRAGLKQLPLDPEIIHMLKDEVKKRNQKHFLISEDNNWILQGWKGRVLSAISLWAANDSTSSHST